MHLTSTFTKETHAKDIAPYRALSGLLIGPSTTIFYDSGFLIGLKWRSLQHGHGDEEE